MDVLDFLPIIVIFLVIIAVTFALKRHYDDDTPRRASVLDWFWNRKSFTPDSNYTSQLQQLKKPFNRKVAVTTNSDLHDYDSFIPCVNRKTIQLENSDFDGLTPADEMSTSFYLNNQIRQSQHLSQRFDVNGIDPEDLVYDDSAYSSKPQTNDYTSRREQPNMYTYQGQSINQFDTVLDEPVNRAPFQVDQAASAFAAPTFQPPQGPTFDQQQFWPSPSNQPFQGTGISQQPFII